MSVATRQIDELFHVMERYVKQDELKSFLSDLAATEAYSTNKSFRETVDKLRKRERGL